MPIMRVLCCKPCKSSTPWFNATKSALCQALGAKLRKMKWPVLDHLVALSPAQSTPTIMWRSMGLHSGSGEFDGIAYMITTEACPVTLDKLILVDMGRLGQRPFLNCAFPSTKNMKCSIQVSFAGHCHVKDKLRHFCNDSSKIHNPMWNSHQRLTVVGLLLVQLR